MNFDKIVDTDPVQRCGSASLYMSIPIRMRKVCWAAVDRSRCD